MTRFFKLLLNVFLFIGVLALNLSASAQSSCDEKFTVTASPVRFYDPVTNTTSYTFKVNRTGASNALSHIDFTIEQCKGDPTPIQQVLSGFVAQTSLDGITYLNNGLGSYGPDGSGCAPGIVFKFDRGMGEESIRYYRLILKGDVFLNITSGFIKYAGNCCPFTILDEFGNPLPDYCFAPGPPILVCNTPDVNLEGCNPPLPAPNTNLVTVVNSGCFLNNGDVDITHEGDATVLVGCLETTTRTYKVTNGCGFFALCTQIITRTVATAPVLSGVPAGGALGCNPITLPVCATTVTATNA
ncbi:MAG: hypothetical protein ABIO05_06930, partial [Ferruginibacter sp.]